MVAPHLTTDPALLRGVRLLAKPAADFAALLTRIERRLFLSAKERAVLDPIVAAAHRLGDPVVAAASEDDARRRIAKGIAAPVLNELLALSQTIATESARRADLFKAGPELEGMFGVKATRSIEDGVREGALVFGGVQGLGDVVVIGGPPPVGRGIYSFVDDPWIHPALAEVLLAVLRGTACQYALIAAFDRGEPIDQVRASFLASTFALGVHELVRLIASLPEASVSDIVLPPHERLDLAALQDEVNETNVRATQKVAQTEMP
jgi:hypothetical protein